MSTFQELSQAVGIAVHKATKEAKETGRFGEAINDYVMSNSNVRYHIENLVNHTIQNTGDNE